MTIISVKLCSNSGKWNLEIKPFFVKKTEVLHILINDSFEKRKQKKNESVRTFSKVVQK